MLSREKVTVLNQTPSAFRQLMAVEETLPHLLPLSLRYIIFGGEALEMTSLKPWFARHGDTTPQLVNMYGITETTVHVTYRPLRADDTDGGSVIGIPIPDLQLYILDDNKQSQPVGVAGEMYVGGAGLARGYLNRPELTAERFISDHLSGVSGARLYRTGDLARRLSNGDIEYLGRIDQQVKIRGFRIELGEIESVILSREDVRDCAVLALPGTQNGDPRLCAWLVCAGQKPPALRELRDYLGTKLPEYMIPSAFVFLDRLPLTTNGKLDRAALPAPESASGAVAVDAFVAPTGTTEIKLATLWADILGGNHISREADFFALGGT
jgi:acyl-coenzyme A synthetase/AMP-(fatty) acid ligase